MRGFGHVVIRQLSSRCPYLSPQPTVTKPRQTYRTNMTDLLSLRAELREFISKERGEVQLPWADAVNNQVPTYHSSPKLSLEIHQVQKGTTSHRSQQKSGIGLKTSLENGDSSPCEAFLHHSYGSEIRYYLDNKPLRHASVGITLSSLAASATACQFCSILYQGIQRVEGFWKSIQRLYGYQDGSSLRKDIQKGSCEAKIRIQFVEACQLVEVFVGWRSLGWRDVPERLRFFAAPGK